MKPNKLQQLIDRFPPYPGINGKEIYLNAAVMVLLVQLEGEYHFVFQKRVSQIRQGGEICFPGGIHDPEHDSSYKKTALRETMEEMGLTADQINIIGRLNTFVSPMGATIDAFVGIAEINDLEDFHINKNEVEKIFTVPVGYFEKNKPETFKLDVIISPFKTDGDQKTVLLPVEELGLPDKYAREWKGGKHTVYVYSTTEAIIWGITARLIKDFIKILVG